jgi:hypothetical protein
MKLNPLIVVVALSLATVPASAEKHARKRLHWRAPTTTFETPESKYPASDPYAVWVAGTYVGRDPDPRVRAAMIREFNHNFDNR